MLHVHHRLGDPELGATFVQDELRTEDLVIVRTRHEGGLVDDALERAVTTRASEWSMVRFVIEGTLLASRGASAVVLERGQAFASIAWGSVLLRSLTTVSEEVRFAWRTSGRSGELRGCDGLLSLTPSARDAFFRLAWLMKGVDSEAARAAAREVVVALRASGVSLEPNLVKSAVPAASHEFARALERVLFPMTQQPMAVDLARALGVGERQALRRASDHFSRFHITVSTWREYVHGMRVGLGAFLMSQRRARTEHVSRLLGFGSPTSFCHAFHDAGLPSPLETQRLLLRT